MQYQHLSNRQAAVLWLAAVGLFGVADVSLTTYALFETSFSEANPVHRLLNSLNPVTAVLYMSVVKVLVLLAGYKLSVKMGEWLHPYQEYTIPTGLIIVGALIFTVNASALLF